MNYIDLIVVGIMALIVSLAVFKIVRDKKSGRKCTGCDGCCQNCHYK